MGSRGVGRPSNECDLPIGDATFSRRKTWSGVFDEAISKQINWCATFDETISTQINRPLMKRFPDSSCGAPKADPKLK